MKLALWCWKGGVWGWFLSNWTASGWFELIVAPLPGNGVTGHTKCCSIPKLLAWHYQSYFHCIIQLNPKYQFLAPLRAFYALWCATAGKPPTWPFSLGPTPQWLDSAIRQHRCIGRKKKFEHEWIHKLWTIICRTLDGVWGQMRVMNWGCSNGVQCCNPHIQSSQTFQVLVVWNKLCDLPNLAAPSKVTCHGQSASRLVCHEGSPCLLGWTLEHPAHTRVHIFSLLRTLRWKDKKKYQEIFNK